MRHMIKGLVAAFAVTTAGVAPAMACGFGGCCDPCGGTTYAQPAYTYAPAPTYAPAYTGCGACGGGGWGTYERLAEPTTQYYYVNQGPTYTGPGQFAPYPTYEEDALPVYNYGHHWHHYHSWHHAYQYGYTPHHYGYGHHYAYQGHYGHYYYGHPLIRRYY
jgi:hypothetical protein